MNTSGDGPFNLLIVLRASDYMVSSQERHEESEAINSYGNKNLRSWGTFHEVSEYFVDKTKGKSFTAFQKKCRCSKPFCALEGRGIWHQMLNYAYKPRGGRKNCKEHIRYLQKEKRKEQKMLVTDGAVSRTCL